MKVYLRFIPMVSIMGMIFFLSHQPGDSFQFPQFVAVDKVAHVMAYGLLAGAFLYGLDSFTNRHSYGVTATIVVLFCLLFGISDEFHQSFIPGRYVSSWDVIANLTGAILVVAWWRVKQAQKGLKDMAR